MLVSTEVFSVGGPGTGSSCLGAPGSSGGAVTRPTRRGGTWCALARFTRPLPLHNANAKIATRAVLLRPVAEEVDDRNSKSIRYLEAELGRWSDRRAAAERRRGRGPGHWTARRQPSGQGDSDCQELHRARRAGPHHATLLREAGVAERGANRRPLRSEPGNPGRRWGETTAGRNSSPRILKPPPEF